MKLRILLSLFLCFLISSTASALPTSEMPIVNGFPVTEKNPIFFSAVAVTAPHVLCTGTLIRPDVVLTAAHCLFDEGIDGRLTPFPAENYKIIFGNSIFTSNSISVKTLRPHPAYVHPRYSNTENDVALIFLSAPAPVPFKPAALLLDSPLQIGTSSSFAGYGVRIPEYPHSAFGYLYQGSAFLSKVNEQNSTVELNAKGANACEGDSGGPVFFERNGKIELWGILTMTKGCVNGSVVTRLSGYREFIQSTISSP